MSNYTKSTNFATKDTLPSGDSGKIVKGTELDNEFNAIASAISSKADTASPTFTGTPAAPTAAANSNTTQLATTAFVFAERTNAATITNKTISADSNTLSGIAASSFVLSNSSGNIDGSAAQKAIPAGVVVGTTDTQTLTNKTLTSPSISSPTITGTPTAPTASAGTNTTQLATTAFVQAALQAVYPVGSVYVNATSSTNPATLLGFGTWVAFGAGRVMVGLDSADADFNTAEETGGAKTVTSTGSISGTVGGTALTEAQMPKHYHQMRGPNSVTAPQNDQGSTGFGVYGGGTPDDGAQQYGTYSTGGGSASGGTATGTANGQSHTHSFSGTFTGNATSVVQPYVVVRMWKRTA